MAANFDWRVSVGFLDLLDEGLRLRVVKGARRIVQPAGLVREYPSALLAGDLIESGLVRAYQVSEDGRQATIGYLHAQQYLGTLPTLAPRPVVYVQDITQVTLLRLDTDNLRTLLETNVVFARALAIHTATLLARVVRVVTVRTLGTIRERIAFDLLERVSDDQLRSGVFDLAVTHEELAQAIGSAREVVSRHLGELRRAGMVSSFRGRIRVDDPERLAAVLDGLVA